MSLLLNLQRSIQINNLIRTTSHNSQRRYLPTLPDIEQQLDSAMELAVKLIKPPPTLLIVWWRWKKNCSFSFRKMLGGQHRHATYDLYFLPSISILVYILLGM